MLVDSKQMPSDSRVWVYQSDRLFTPEEENKISELAVSFIGTWTAHNQELRASFEIRYHVFLIFMIDEKFALASGCSIDKSVHFVKGIEKQFSLSLMDRMIFSFKDESEVKLVKRNKFEQLLSEGIINDDTVVFNNLVQSKKELDEKWEVPIRNSWHRTLIS